MDGLKIKIETARNQDGQVTMWTAAAYDAIGLVAYAYSHVSEAAARRGLARKLTKVKQPVFRFTE